MTYEITALQCAVCFHTWSVESPDSNDLLREAVESNSTCKECGSDKILLSSYYVRQTKHGSFLKATSRKQYDQVRYVRESA